MPIDIVIQAVDLGLDGSPKSGRSAIGSANLRVIGRIDFLLNAKDTTRSTAT